MLEMDLTCCFINENAVTFTSHWQRFLFNEFNSLDTLVINILGL